MQIVDKIMDKNATKKSGIGRSKEIVLPRNESQIRPLSNKLSHNGERIKTWIN